MIFRMQIATISFSTMSRTEKQQPICSIQSDCLNSSTEHCLQL